ncbi:type III pantothenate kinase [Hyphobacterium sp. CCMP332]|nr:type III pantothenate kinase [Hyphobacterium sp. CCMP332]
MYSLLIDRGNSRIKAAIVKNGSKDVSDARIFSNFKELKDFIQQAGPIDQSIYSDVQKNSKELEEVLYEKGLNFIRCNYLLKLPFKLDYHTPQSLGDDRIAAVAAAHSLYSGKNVLVIDAGTCITYDFLDNKSVYHGGAISPGIKMRFEALNKMTGNLPHVEFENEKINFPGKSTQDSIKNGVLNGIIFETQAFIDELNNKHEELIVLIGGGDRKYFESNLKGNIFARENLILEGLISILSFHDSH